MTVDRYAGAGSGWATGASLVYAPIARMLVDRAPHPLAGRLVLDAGAGTGVVTSAVLARGGRVLAADMSRDMLAWNARSRPCSVAADVRALPLRRSSVDDSVAAFVLNHLTDPDRGLAELARVTRPGGAILVCVYSGANRSAARDRIDEVAAGAGWRVPEWYLRLKADSAPLLATTDRMAAALRGAGLIDLAVDEVAADVGVEDAERLVDYRLGQAHYARWLARIGAARAEDVRRAAVAAVRPLMVPYRPVVVFAGARVPRRG